MDTLKRRAARFGQSSSEALKKAEQEEKIKARLSRLTTRLHKHPSFQCS